MDNDNSDMGCETTGCNRASETFTESSDISGK